MKHQQQVYTGTRQSCHLSEPGWLNPADFDPAAAAAATSRINLLPASWSSAPQLALLLLLLPLQHPPQ
jgi:hypothetical protein